jgi:hypothetical protein
MRARKPHWPTRSPFKPETPETEHLLSERTLRERIPQITASLQDPDRERVRSEVESAIRHSRI